jgi:FIMAH domain
MKIGDPKSARFRCYSGPFSIAVQGTTTIHARAGDVAGNVENPGAMLAVSIDSGVPSITIAAPAARDYLHSDLLQLSFAAADSGSGLAVGNPTATLDGCAFISGQTIQLLSVPLGPRTLVVSAADQAGNVGAQTVAFRVKATIDSLIAAVNTFAAQGQIDPGRVRSLQSKLSDAKQAMNRGSLTAARGKLSDFAATVSAQSGSGIAVNAAPVLLADVQYVLDTM